MKFAGTDAALDEEELAASAEVCSGEQAFDLPGLHLPDRGRLQPRGCRFPQPLAEVIAGIFAEEITTWNDPAIAELNPDADLPDTAVVPVHRSDDSGTTENFTQYLSDNAPEAWTHGPIETWPIDGLVKSGDGTSGLISAVESGNGTIGYADASQAGNLGTASVQVGEEFVDYSAEAAAKAVDVSPREEGRAENDIVMELDRTTTEAGTYPIVLISYLALCGAYEDEATGNAVKSYASFMISEQGQQVAAENAGSAPIPDEPLRTEAQTAIDGITVG